MPDFTLAQLSGINNRTSNTLVPPNKCRNAVNVDFYKDGSIHFPRMGYIKDYTGTSVKSLYEYEHEFGLGLFVDNGYLKRLNSDYTATNLIAVSDNEMSYCLIDDIVYLSNGSIAKRYIKGEIKEWGIDVPPMPPRATAIDLGGLYAGDYRVTLTWLVETSPNHYEESGAPSSVKVTVEEGGGIALDQFPNAPSYVDKVAVYCTSTNGNEFYLYGEYPADTPDVFITTVHKAIPLTKQFHTKVTPGLGLTPFNGRIYWIDGKSVIYTDDQNYSTCPPFSYMTFEESPTNIVAVTDALYITTNKKTYKVVWVDPEVPKLIEAKTYGFPKGAICYDDNNKTAYGFSNSSFCTFSSEGIQEIGLDDVAPPIFEKGSIAKIEHNGNSFLVFVGQEGTVSNLQHSDYSTAEIARKGSAL